MSQLGSNFVLKYLRFKKDYFLGSGKYVVIINLANTARIIMMNKIPDSTNVII